MNRSTSVYQAGLYPYKPAAKLLYIFLLLFLSASCRIILISGYDAVLDDTTVKMKRDFNLFWLRFDRSIRDNNPRNQDYQNFLDYYDQMDVDLMIIDDRAAILPAKSQQVKSQVQNIRQLFSALKNTHQKGIKDIAANDPLADDKHDYRNGINSALNAIMLLQQELKTVEKSN